MIRYTIRANKFIEGGVHKSCCSKRPLTSKELIDVYIHILKEGYDVNDITIEEKEILC